MQLRWRWQGRGVGSLGGIGRVGGHVGADFCVSFQPHCKAEESLLLSRLHLQLKAARSLIENQDGRFSFLRKEIELSDIVCVMCMRALVLLVVPL